MAREKKDTRARFVINLLGGAFGARTRIIRKAKSAENLEHPKSPFFIGTPHVPLAEPRKIIQTAPIQQYATFAPFPYQQPNSQYVPGFYPPPPPPTQYFIAPYAQSIPSNYLGFPPTLHPPSPIPPPTPAAPSVPEPTVEAAIPVTKHVCGDCGRIRSRKYHHENPIKPGETPAIDFCRKCQRDASVTSSDHSDRDSKDEKKGNGEKKDDKKREKKKSCNLSKKHQEVRVHISKLPK